MKTGLGTRSPAQEHLAAKAELTQAHLKDDGTFPNNHLPLLVYRRAVLFTDGDPASILERIFEANDWRGSWRNGIYPYHHYHSTSHEVLGVYQGAARVQLGGEGGVIYELHPGDVLVIPAGVAHKNLGGNGGFGVVGAYPEGRDSDMNYGRPGEHPQADRNISQVPIPKGDPLYGERGPLLRAWTKG